MHCKRLIQHTLYTAVRISNDIPGFDGGVNHEDDNAKQHDLNLQSL